jgi:extracellular elastinolytic metalloproteinase
VPISTSSRFLTYPSPSHVYRNSATASISSSSPTISLQEAIKSAEETLHGTYTPPPSSASASVNTEGDKKFLEYLAKDDGSATLVYAIPVSNDSTGTSFLAYVDAQKGTVAAAVSYVAQ